MINAECYNLWEVEKKKFFIVESNIQVKYKYYEYIYIFDAVKNKSIKANKSLAFHLVSHLHTTLKCWFRAKIHHLKG